MFEMNSIAVPSEHYSFFTVMMELRKINLVAINKVNLKDIKRNIKRKYKMFQSSIQEI
jgi:hypothetical protein